MYQIWSYYIPLERKLNAEEDSHKNHGLKIICSGNIDANMSRDKYVVYDTPIKYQHAYC